MQFTKRCLYLLIASLSLATVVTAQSPDVTVRWDSGARKGAVVTAVVINSSGHRAGSAVMGRACELGRGANKPYLAVRNYIEEEDTVRKVVESGRTAYRAGADGVPRPVGYEADRYTNVPRESALISVTFISEQTVVLLKGDFDIIETRGCTVYSKKASR